MAHIPNVTCKNAMAATFLILFGAYSTALVASNDLERVSEVSKDGITWSFESERPAGQYANGDWWVIGPVTITEITPESKEVEGRIVHGSMVDPFGQVNGWDSGTGGPYPGYDASLNVAPSQTGEPLYLEEGTVVSAESSFEETSGSARGIIQRFGLLTVVAEEPPANAFRPAPYKSDTSARWTEEMLNYDVLADIDRQSVNAPSLDEVSASVEGFWNDHVGTAMGYRQQSLTAREFQASYGRDIGHASAYALLSLHLNYTDREKRDLLIQMVQKGIDVYGAQSLGADWRHNGGHYGMQKARMVLAAMVLGDDEIQAAANAEEHFVHGVDQQTFYVSEEDIQRTSTNDKDPQSTSGNECGRSGASLYEPEDRGIAEWGRSHHYSPGRFDCREWGASYRRVTGGSYFGNVVAMNLLDGAEDVWNHPPLFDYMDRYYDEEKSRNRIDDGRNSIRPFYAEMYEAYLDIANTAPPDAPTLERER